MIVRENLSGLYQCRESTDGADVECRFHTLADSVAASAEVACNQAAERDGRVTLVRKEHGTPRNRSIMARLLSPGGREARGRGSTAGCRLRLLSALASTGRVRCDPDLKLFSEIFWLTSGAT